MTTNLLIFGILTLIALVVGVVAGYVTAWWLRRPEPITELELTTEPERDPLIDGEIDLASVRWAEANNQPDEAAGLMAARLKTLHDIGKGKGWD